MLSMGILIELSVFVSMRRCCVGYLVCWAIRSITHEDDKRASASWSQDSSIVSHIEFKPCKANKQTRKKRIIYKIYMNYWLFSIIIVALIILTACARQISSILGRNFLCTTFSCISSSDGWQPSWKIIFKRKSIIR